MDLNSAPTITHDVNYGGLELPRPGVALVAVGAALRGSEYSSREDPAGDRIRLNV